jgi:hypothetical protein
MNKLEQLPELFKGEAGISNNPEHCDRVHGVVSRNDDGCATVRHDDVTALANNLKSSTLKGPHGVEVIHSWELAHC